MRKILNEIRQRKWLMILIYILILFLLYLSFWNQGRFASDEEEIFVKGQQMAQGQKLFVDIITQHMPIMYHFAAIFSVLGIKTVAGFRLMFYLLFSCLWGLSFAYYGAKLGRKAVGLSPIVYLIIVSGVSNATCVLSDQMQAIGTAYLLFAILLFYKKRMVNILDNVMISIAIFISFYAAFITVFSIFAAFIFVLAIEIRDAVQAKRHFVKEIVYLIKKYILMVLIIALPTVLFLIYYAQIDVLRGFIAWAYHFNREVYPRYIGGYGDNPLSALFQGISGLASALSIEQFSTTAIVNATFLVILVLFLIEKYRENHDVIYALGIILYIIACGSRETFGFHGLAAISVIGCIDSFYLCKHVPLLWEKVKISRIKIGLFIFICAFLTSNYLSKLPSALSFTTTEYINTKSTAYALGAITDKNERVGFASLDYTSLLQAEVLPASFGCSDLPWYWEWCGTQEIAELNANMPRAFYYAPSNTWGYKFNDYAPEITQLINENYKSLGSLGYSSVYVLKDYYDEAVAKLRPDKIFIAANETDNVGQIVMDSQIEQTFFVENDVMMSSLDLMIGTYQRNNTSSLKCLLVNNNTGESVELFNVSVDGFADNSYRQFNFDDYLLVHDCSYTLVFTSPDGSDGNAITIYCGASSTPSDKHFATINGERKNYDLAIRVNSEWKLQPIIENVVE